MNNKRAKLGDPLTDREIDVVMLLCEGHSNKVIGSKLDLSQHTIKFHIFNLMCKFGSESRVSVAVAYTRMRMMKLDATVSTRAA